jgi:hypothetical protein
MLNGFNYNYWEWLFEFALKEAKNTKNIDERRIVIHTILDVLHIHPELQEEVFTEFNLTFNGIIKGENLMNFYKA